MASKEPPRHSAKYIPGLTQNTAALFNKYPDRFLFGTVASGDETYYLAVLFDAARKKVKEWGRVNINDLEHQINYEPDLHHFCH